MPALFQKRSVEEELLDQPDIPQEDIFRNLYELDAINRRLGGHRVTLAGLDRLMSDKTRTYRIIDLGCGGGDTLLAIDSWANKRGYSVSLTGVDILRDAITYAGVACKDIQDLTLIQSDFRQLPRWDNEFDIAICSLFCHHLYGDDLDALIQKMYNISALGIVINDLHRHWLAYYSIQLLTRLLSKSKLVRNDAPISVLRGFSRVELKDLLNSNGIDNGSVEWMWAFRFLCLVQKSA